MEDLITVVVPVYNVAQYLDRCFENLTKQTYQNIEILLIDDGSTDRSGEICDSWSARDPRIRVFHKPNGGLSDARNFGLHHASGSYIAFLDGDDWYDLRFLEVMHRAITQTGADIAECDYLYTTDKESRNTHNPVVSPPKIFTGRECFHQYLQTTFFVGVWNKLYRRELIAGMPFQIGVFHEDEYWTYRIFSIARKVCRLGYVGYYYFHRSDSIVHTAPSLKRISNAFEACCERVDFIEAHYPEYASVGYSKMMYTCMYLYNQVIRSEIPEKAELMEQLLSYFHVVLGKYLNSRQYQKEMWRFLLFSRFPRLYCRYNY